VCKQTITEKQAEVCTYRLVALKACHAALTAAVHPRSWRGQVPQTPEHIGAHCKTNTFELMLTKMTIAQKSAEREHCREHTSPGTAGDLELLYVRLQFGVHVLASLSAGQASGSASRSKAKVPVPNANTSQLHRKNNTGLQATRAIKLHAHMSHPLLTFTTSSGLTTTAATRAAPAAAIHVSLVLS